MMTDTGHVLKVVEDLVERDVLPIDDEHDGDVQAAGGDALRTRLQDLARSAGVLAPHAPVDCGGLGLNMEARAPIFEAAGRSLFGPLASTSTPRTKATSTSSTTSPPRRSAGSTWSPWPAGRCGRRSP